MKQEFNLGDRVVVVDKKNIDIDGKNGTVCYVDMAMSLSMIGIEFDNKVRGGHDCVGHAKEGHGFWIQIFYLKKIPRILSIKDWKEKQKKEWIEVPEINLQLFSVHVNSKIITTN